MTSLFPLIPQQLGHDFTFRYIVKINVVHLLSDRLFPVLTLRCREAINSHSPQLNLDQEVKTKKPFHVTEKPQCPLY